MDYDTLSNLIEIYRKDFSLNDSYISKEKLLTDRVILSKYIEIKTNNIIQQIKSSHPNESTILLTNVKLKYIADCLSLMDRQLR